MNDKTNNSNGTKRKFSQNVAAIAGKVVSQQGWVSPIDLFVGMGWLNQEKLSDWKKGKTPYLERVITANLSKLSKTMKEFKSWATHSKLKSSITIYKHKNCKLRFSKSGNPYIESAYHHWGQVLPRAKGRQRGILLVTFK